MKEFRMGNGVTEHYNSFAEMGKAWGCKPVTKKRPRDEEKLNSARTKFLGVCPVCKSPMKYVSTDYSVCSNTECRGRNVAAKGEEPRYVTVIREFDEKGKEISSNLFD